MYEYANFLSRDKGLNNNGQCSETNCQTSSHV